MMNNTITHSSLVRGASLFLAAILLLTGAVASLGAEAARKDMKVALVLPGGLGGSSFLQSAYRGLKLAEQELPGVSVTLVEPAEPAEYESSIRAMARAGYDMIITLTFRMLDATNKVASQYPGVKFVIVDAVSDHPNVSSVMFREHEGSYLAGVLAGLMTKSGAIGFIGGVDSPQMRRFQVGFETGARAVNPKVKTMVGYTGSFDNPGKAKELALTQYERGVDIIFHAAGKSGAGVVAAAKEQGKYVIGVDADQCPDAPDNTLASMLKRVDVAVFNVIKEGLAGSLKPGLRVYGLQENAVGPCWLYEDTMDLSGHRRFDGLERALKVVREYRDRIVKGEIVVPDAMEMGK